METVAPVTQGVTDAAVELGTFRLTETSHVPNTRLAAHQHAHAAVTFVLQGAFTERFGAGRELACGSMTVLSKPAGAMHTNQYSGVGARSFILECLTASTLYDGLHSCTPHTGLARVVPGMLELYAAFRTLAPERLALAEELALEAAEEASSASPRATSRRPRWLNGVADRIERHCPRPLSLTVLATEVAVHPVYLARVFRRFYGQSIGGYSLQCRIRLAMHQLSMSTVPISRVAQDCGFSDQSHFTRSFSRVVGASPARFRRSVRAEVGRSAR